MNHLDQVFERIRKANMKLKASKCEILKPEIDYLGHVITNKGELKVNKDKVNAIEKLPPPTSLKGARQFLGMAGFYRKFIKDFSKTAEPLTGLTRKNAVFHWGKEQQDAFDKIKQSLITAPVLHLPEQGKPFVLYTDASDATIGAVLAQDVGGDHKPVYYLSHHLSDTQQRWPVIEKECYAIVFALEKFRPYLEGTRFKIYSDHAPLKYIDSANNRNAKLQRWAVKISSFGGQIDYIKGKSNVVADFLSRVPKDSTKGDLTLSEVTQEKPKVEQQKEEQGNQESTPIPLTEHLHFVEEQLRDKKIVKIRNSLQHQGIKSKFHKNYIIKNDLLYHVNKEEQLRLEVPVNLRETILKEIHEGLGHLGRDKTLQHIQQRFYWKGMTADVMAYTAKCSTCAERNLRVEPSPLQDTPIATYPFQRIGVDTTGAYPITERDNRFCITVTDHFSGFVEIIPVPDKKAATVCEVLLNQVFNRYGWPMYITSDNGLEFANAVLDRLTSLGNIHRIRTSIYHPRSNLAERPHRVIHDIMAKLCRRDDWDLYVPSIRAAINFSTSSSRGYSPFYLVFHRDPQIPLDTLIGEQEDCENPDDFLDLALRRAEISRELVTKRLKIAKEKNREYYNTLHHAKECKLKVGDSVYLYNFVRKDKFDKRWIQGYVIIKKTSPVSFLIENSETGQQQRVHADALRRDWNSHSKSEESQLESKEESTGSDPEVSEEDTARDSDDSDATEIYEYISPKPSRSPSPQRRPTVAPE